MNFHEFSVLILPLATIFFAVVALVIWGMLGNTNEK